MHTKTEKNSTVGCTFHIGKAQLWHSRSNFNPHFLATQKLNESRELGKEESHTLFCVFLEKKKLLFSQLLGQREGTHEGPLGDTAGWSGRQEQGKASAVRKDQTGHGEHPKVASLNNSNGSVLKGWSLVTWNLVEAQGCAGRDVRPERGGLARAC